MVDSEECEPRRRGDSFVKSYFGRNKSAGQVTIGPLTIVPGNECDVVHLLQNLISNAEKYRSEAEVEVHITAQRCGPDWVIRMHVMQQDS